MKNMIFIGILFFALSINAFAGSGTENDPYTIAQARALPESATMYWALGYIVGGRYDDFDPPFDNDYGLGCADSDTETDVNNCLQVKLESAQQPIWGVMSNPGNIGKLVKFLGHRDIYGGSYPSFEDIEQIYEAGGGAGPTNKPTVETIINNVVPTNNQPVIVYVSAFDDVTTIDEVTVFYSINNWSSEMSAPASHSAGKVYTAVLPAYSGDTTVKYSAYAVNSYTNSGYAVITNSYTVRSSDIIGGSYTCRVMAANTTSGNYQAYENPGIRIFQGLKPDIVAIQEFNYNSGSLRDLIDTAFGTNYYYYCEGGGEQIPNGIVSRWPFKASGEWEDVEVSNRDFAWGTIDIPGPKDLHIVSVHLLTSGSTVRNAEATEIKAQINAHFPENDYIVVGGDMNTGSRTEAAINTYKNSPIPLSDSHVPKDQNGNDDTNAGRSSPYDWVLPNTALNNYHTATIVDGHSFADGLVYDSRVTSPYSMLPSPILSGDSGVTGMQHMGVVKDYIIPNGDGTTTNYSPVLNHINNYIVNSGDTVSFPVVATDVDDDTISLTCSDSLHFTSVPAAGTVTGNYSWSTIGVEPGDYSIIFTATANTLESKQMINISVVPEPCCLLYVICYLLIFNCSEFISKK